MRTRGFGAALFLLLAASGAANAQTPAEKARAKEAYDRGVEAHKRGDYQRAAEEFAKADAIAPSSVALQAAVDEAMDADDPAIGAELIERSQRAPATGELAKSLEAARKKFAGRAGRVKIGCPAGATCLATLDGAAIAIGKPAWSRAGQHTVVVQVDGEAQTKLVDVKADQLVDVTPTAKSTAPPVPTTSSTVPPSPPPFGTATSAPEKPDHPQSPPKLDIARDGLPPVIFWAGAGATVLFAGTSIALAVVTKGQHDDFVKAGCDQTAASGCSGKASTGKTLMILTDVGFGATAIAGIATLVIGIGFTDWKGHSSAGGPVVAPVAGGAVGGWTAAF